MGLASWGAWELLSPQQVLTPWDSPLSWESDQCAFCRGTACEPGHVPLLPARPAPHLPLTWQHVTPSQQKARIINTRVRDLDPATVSSKDGSSVDADAELGA